MEQIKKQRAEKKLIYRVPVSAAESASNTNGDLEACKIATRKAGQKQNYRKEQLVRNFETKRGRNERRNHLLSILSRNFDCKLWATNMALTSKTGFKLSKTERGVRPLWDNVGHISSTVLNGSLLVTNNCTVFSEAWSVSEFEQMILLLDPCRWGASKNKKRTM